MLDEYRHTEGMSEIVSEDDARHTCQAKTILGPVWVGWTTRSKKDGTRMVTNLCPTAATLLAGTRCILALLLLGYKGFCSLSVHLEKFPFWQPPVDEICN